MVGDPVVDAIEKMRETIAELEAKNKELSARATDNYYMGMAYRSMLGPKGIEVAAMWDKKRVKRVHHSWGPDAYTKLDGEGRAAVILEMEEAMKTAVPMDRIDG